MIRGWCPTVHAPMPSGDGLLVRVKPFGGRLPAAALRALAAAVQAYGNGVVELTGRGNLQVRGVRDAQAFARAMVAAGLADADPEREARRNVVTVPPCDDAVVAAAEALLAQTAGLPPKFCVSVQGATLLLDGRPIASLQDALAQGGAGGHFAAPARTGRGHLLYPAFGQTDAAALADLADRVAEIRTTPWRAFLAPCPVRGWPATPNATTACPGAPACASATVPTRADALRLEEAGFAGLHVSGCAKGCAHPRAATTLVGRDGRYDLVRHGRAGDIPERRGLNLDQAMAAL